MATVYANIAVNFDTLSLNDIFADRTSIQAPDNVNYVNTGSPLNPDPVYEDILRIGYNSSNGTVPSVAYFGGTGLTYNFAIPSVTGGTMTGYFHTVDLGSGFVAAWGLEGFSYSAFDIYNAAVTEDTADEMAIITSIFSGADTFTLSPGADVASGYAGADRMLGGGGTDTLTGGAGNDTLNGGNGLDRLVGGPGNDTFLVTAGDTLVEVPSGGAADVVSSAANWTLGANLEQLLLTGNAAANGSGNALANTMTGNAAANVLNGQAGNDTLSGVGGNDTLAGAAGADALRGVAGNDVLKGGAGNDVLTGGAGNDTFVFDAPLVANIDTIIDVSKAADTIALDDDIFTAFNAAASTHLVAGDIGTRIIYNQSTGALLYDGDGAGGAGAVRFATLGAASHPALSNADILGLVLIVA